MHAALEIKCVKELIDMIKSTNTKVNTDLVLKACDYAIRYHGAQLRESGDPYYSHPIEVAKIAASMKLDQSSIITAILHDTLEDTVLTYDDIKREFGEHIAKLVDGVTKLTKIEHQPEYIRQAESFRKLLLALSEDIRVLLIKLADRVHNMRTIKFKAPEKRIRIAKETMDIYAALAERIGMQKIKLELQDLSFAELYPDARESILSRLEYLREKGATEVENIVHELSEMMKLSGVNARVYGREKAPCSIWFKMQRKNISFEQLSDIIAFRIIANNIEDCYRALGLIHSHFQMVPGEFMDFISIPKDNGYRSIHTVVIGPAQHRIEVQIRTEEMHEIAEFGVAAHWVYKQGEEYKTEGKQFKWVRELLNIIDNSEESADVLENTKMQMYYDQVFCFTPAGQLIVLPKGATPVDFAYAVHSDVGNHCVSAKVNSRIVPLQIQLSNGDQVEIQTSKTQTPSPAWEKFVVTAKARAEIKKFIRTQQHGEYLHLGRAILAKEVRSFNAEFTDEMLIKHLGLFKKNSIQDLYAAVGEGAIDKKDILTVIYPEQYKKSTQVVASKSNNLLQKLKIKRNKTANYSADNKLLIKGLTPGVAVHYATCCHPIPGDQIVGIVHQGKGITVHTADCDNLNNYSANPEMWLEISWDKDSADESYIGRIKVVLTNEIGSLATLTSSIAKDHANIHNVKVAGRTEEFFELVIDIAVRGSKHLNNIITNLRSKSRVYSADRSKF